MVLEPSTDLPPDAEFLWVVLSVACIVEKNKAVHNSVSKNHFLPEKPEKFNEISKRGSFHLTYNQFFGALCILFP
jgi:hypothetical protein